MNPATGSRYEVVAGSANGTEYEIASGDALEDLGEKRMAVLTAEEHSEVMYLVVLRSERPCSPFVLWSRMDTRSASGSVTARSMLLSTRALARPTT